MPATGLAVLLGGFDDAHGLGSGAVLGVLLVGGAALGGCCCWPGLLGPPKDPNKLAKGFSAALLPVLAFSRGSCMACSKADELRSTPCQNFSR